ncbi:MAG: isoprenylcysteine carboxylmethyltransferase family protein [Mesorhizobium sp.]|nr:isoprenylcysteine carboxylmethyltransferase family protein [Mesorhizobium sp.]MCO5163750.1 isoprenylcysteine carboxylmethyltransferase family protein [Mesorhizobium sp.]
MSDVSDRPNRFPWPPVIYVAAIAIALILGYLVPLPWLPSPASDLLFAFGWLLVAAAIAIDIGAMRTMSKHRTTIMPHRGSAHLVTDGPFSFTRNPIYLGNTMLTFGVGLISGIAWFLPMALIAAFATQKLAIEREERHLYARFGKRFRDYTKRVRRWI